MVIRPQYSWLFQNTQLWRHACSVVSWRCSAMKLDLKGVGLPLVTQLRCRSTHDALASR